MQLRNLLLVVITASLTSCSYNIKKAERLIAATSSSLDRSLRMLADNDLKLSQFTQEFIEENAQSFVTDITGNAIIKGRKGLELKIDRSALEHLDGSRVEGPIHVKLLELTNSE